MNEQPSSLTKQASRDGFGQAMVELAQARNDIMAVCGDLDSSLRLTDFKERYPHRIIQVGVAEQNLIGVAAGLTLAGKTVFAASFAVFSPGRSWDQIRISVCYSNLNVKVVGGHAGLVTGPDGASHQALEDIAMMRALPNMIVVVPCDAQEARKATHALANTPGPAYLRLYREALEPITKPNSHFEIGKAEVLFSSDSGDKVAIIACGYLVAEALEAAEQLATEGINVRVINCHTIKPIDKAAIIQTAKETKALITLEDHQISGGLGSAVAEVLVQAAGNELNKQIPVKMMAMPDKFGESGLAAELLNKYKLNKEAIIQSVKQVLLQHE